MYSSVIEEMFDQVIPKRQSDLNENQQALNRKLNLVISKARLVLKAHYNDRWKADYYCTAYERHKYESKMHAN